MTVITLGIPSRFGSDSVQIQIQKYLFRFKATGPLQADFLN